MFANVCPSPVPFRPLLATSQMAFGFIAVRIRDLRMSVFVWTCWVLGWGKIRMVCALLLQETHALSSKNARDATTAGAGHRTILGPIVDKLSSLTQPHSFAPLVRTTRTRTRTRNEPEPIFRLKVSSVAYFPSVSNSCRLSLVHLNIDFERFQCSRFNVHNFHIHEFNV